MFGENSEWAYLHFTENNGMAFGMEFEGEYGKLFLSVFRILAISAIGWYLWHLIKRKAHIGLISAMALVFAGAFGNILDSCFYGLLFSESTVWEAAKLFPTEGGYAGFLHGRVVDMFYFPIIEGHFPQSFPFWKGEPFTFFSPVFNLADSSISVGVAMIILFSKKYFPKKTDTPLAEENSSINTQLNAGETILQEPDSDTENLNPVNEQ